MHIDFLPFWGWAELPSGNSDIETQWFPTEIDLQMAMLIHRRLHLPLSYLYISIYLWLLWYVRYVIPNNCFIVIDLLSIYTFLSNVYIFLYIYIYMICLKPASSYGGLNDLSLCCPLAHRSWASAGQRPPRCGFSRAFGGVIIAKLLGTSWYDYSTMLMKNLQPQTGPGQSIFSHFLSFWLSLHSSFFWSFTLSSSFFIISGIIFLNHFFIIFNHFLNMFLSFLSVFIIFSFQWCKNFPKNGKLRFSSFFSFFYHFFHVFHFSFFLSFFIILHQFHHWKQKWF